MPQKPSVKAELTEAQADLSALQADLPKIEALLQQHTEAVEMAKRNGPDFAALAELQAKRGGFESVLTQHRRDIQAAERRVSELQAEAEKEDLLGVVTEASVRYPEIRAELDQLFAEADAALFAAIQRAAVLAAEGNELLRSADSAVRRIIGKTDGQPWYGFDEAARSERYDAAVAGTDVPALSQRVSAFSPWPANYGGSSYKAIHLFDPYALSNSVQLRTASPADPQHDDLLAGAVAEMLGQPE